MNFEGRLSLMFELYTLEFSSLLSHGFLPSFLVTVAHFASFFLKKLQNTFTFFYYLSINFFDLFHFKHPYLRSANDI